MNYEDDDIFELDTVFLDQDEYLNPQQLQALKQTIDYNKAAKIMSSDLPGFEFMFRQKLSKALSNPAVSAAFEDFMQLWARTADRALVTNPDPYDFEEDYW